MEYCVFETFNTGEFETHRFRDYQEAADYLLEALCQMQSHTEKSSVCYQKELATLVSPETFRMWRLVKHE